MLEAADHGLRAGQLRAEVLHQTLERRRLVGARDLGGGFGEGGAAGGGGGGGGVGGPPLGATVQRRAHLQVIEL